MATNGRFLPSGTMRGQVEDVNGNRIRPGDRPELLDQWGVPIQDRQGFLLPHFRTFSAIYNAIGRTYRYTWDEAVKNLPKNSLAMRRDVGLRGILQERQYPVAQLEWSIETDDQEDAGQKAFADLMAKIIKATPRFQQMRRYLQEAVWYGRYGSQVVPEKKVIDGKKVQYIARHAPVNGDKIQFTWAGTPAIFVHAGYLSELPANYVIPEGEGIQGIYTDRAPALLLGDPEWRKRFIIHKHEVDDADYFEGEMAGGVHGVGIRSIIYWEWWLRQEFLSWLTDFLERVGLGMTVFTYEMGNRQSQLAAEAAAKSQSRNNVIAWPRWVQGQKSGSGIERIEVATSGGELLNGAITYFDNRMERYMIGQDMSGRTVATGIGGDAQAELKADTKYRIIKYDAQNADQTITDDLLIPLATLNFGELPFGYRFASHVDKPISKDRIDAARLAWETGVDLKKDEIRDIGGFSKPGDDDEVVTNEAAGLAPTVGGPGSVPGGNGSPDKKPAQDKGSPSRNIKARHYSKAVDWHGLKLHVQVKAGEKRDEDEVKDQLQHFDYGYIKDTEGADGDEVDCFLGPDMESDRVYVVDQLDGRGDFDECKVLIGFNSKAEATQGYLANYPPDWKRFGGIKKFKVKKFLDWLDGDADEPVQMAKQWNEEDHPREPAGSPEGGQFALSFSESFSAEQVETLKSAHQGMPPLFQPKAVRFMPDRQNRGSRTIDDAVLLAKEDLENLEVIQHELGHVWAGEHKDLVESFAQLGISTLWGAVSKDKNPKYDVAGEALAQAIDAVRTNDWDEFVSSDRKLILQWMQEHGLIGEKFHKPGPTDSSRKHAKDGPISRADFDYGPREAPYQCQFCGFMEAAGTCQLYRELTANLTKAFQLNPHVRGTDGCDAWKANTGS